VNPLGYLCDALTGIALHPVNRLTYLLSDRQERTVSVEDGSASPLESPSDPAFPQSPHAPDVHHSTVAQVAARSTSEKTYY